MSLSNAFYNRLLNPLVRGVLRSPMHRAASGTTAILHFTGRRSGRALDTPLSYTREGDTVRFMSSTNTGWWKNFRDGPVPVEVEIARQTFSGTARLWEGDCEPLREGVRRFLTALPRDAVIYGVKLGRDKRPIEDSLARAAPRLVLVEVTLDPVTP